MKSRKHLVLLTAALLLGTLVASAKPGPKPPKPPKAENPCKGFFEGPFFDFAGSHETVEGSEGKLCFWEGDPLVVHAKVDIPLVQSNQSYCGYLTDLGGFVDLFNNSTEAFGRLLFEDTDGNSDIFFDSDICVNGCGDEGFDGGYLQPAFWVWRKAEDDFKACHPFRMTENNQTPAYVTGFRLPDEAF